MQFVESISVDCSWSANSETSLLVGHYIRDFTCLQGGTGADEGMAQGGPLRNVQSMHTFYPQSGPGGQPAGASHAQDDTRPHSWDNSNANAQLNNLQQMLGSQQILQQLASLNQQQVKPLPVCPL